MIVYSMSENITPSSESTRTPSWFNQDNTLTNPHHHLHISNHTTDNNSNTDNNTGNNINNNNNDNHTNTDMTHDFIHKAKFNSFQQHPLHLEELNNWTDFTNLDEADFNALEEQLSTLNKNNHQQHQHHITLQHHHSISSQQDKELTEFSHTAFPPIETTPHEEEEQEADFQYSNLEQDEDEHLQSAVRPDLIFTPLVSPAVTPLDKNPSSSSSSSYQNTSSRRHLNQQQDNNGIFSPLTSPALEFQKIKSSPIMRIKKDNHDDSTHSHHHHHRRKSTASSSNKTPGSTPIVGPSMPGRVTKASPVVKPKRHSSITATGKYLGDIKLPESVMDFKTPSSVPRRNSKQQQFPQYQQQQQTQQQQQQQYAQQQQQQQQQHHHQQMSHNDENGHPVTPATLMNFKMEDNDIQESQQQQQQQTVILNTNREHSNSSSPVILPSSASLPTTMGPRRSSSISSKRQSRRNSNSPSITSMSNTNIKDSSTTTASTIDQDESQEFQYDKKTNHKLAEQGRRNRMNNAIQNLDKLIPQDWKKNVVVPSKATTIEIAIEYIKTLQRENSQRGKDQGNYENDDHQQNHHQNINDTSDSISPYD